MPRKETDPIREHRIDYEIIVDAYDEAERAMGWYYYL
ncbi:MAG: calcium-binding protein, partial [Pseudanabaenaceae cyanobacterium bins.39]|nr:calcium-binding protein [Pseudanabaenaceae cyanobacterium bins.39]